MIIKRKADISFYSKRNDTATCNIDGCIDFNITNTGESTIYFGFTRDSEPDVPLEPGETAPFPLYRECEEWAGEVYIKFGAVIGTARIMKTI
jgi:hypothetical protein